jgi:hypothetical protein
MLRLVPLLARRAADLPRFRVRAQLRHTPGYGADLELEPLAWRDGRAGDVPYDLIPDVVPAVERAIASDLHVARSDVDALDRVRAILDYVDAAGLELGEGEDRLIIELRDALDRGAAPTLDDSVRGLRELRDELREYQQPAARPVYEELRRQMGDLDQYGFLDLPGAEQLV